MVALQGFYIAVSTPEGFNPACSGNGSSHGSNIRHFILDRRLADIRIIVFPQFSAWSINDKVDLFILDGIHNIRTAFMHFVDSLGLKTIFGEKLMGPAGGPDLKPEFFEASGNLQRCLFVLIRNSYQHRASDRQILLAASRAL